MTSDFYHAFEDRHRGSREDIQQRLRIYLPFVRAMLPYCEHAHAIDLGCGRGEWLQILEEEGVQAKGVDLDADMLRTCREFGLDVASMDALAFLENLPDDSQMIVTAFHVVEHIPFATLLELVDQAMRVLVPGGLLIMETPNPENITVGASSFYLDPTHERPIPPGLLQFVSERAGFRQHQILRLQESSDLKSKRSASLLEVLAGVSPDYSIVGQKVGSHELMEVLESLLAGDYGCSLYELATRFQENMELELAKARALAEQAMEMAENARAGSLVAMGRNLSRCIKKAVRSLMK